MFVGEDVIGQPLSQRLLTKSGQANPGPSIGPDRFKSGSSESPNRTVQHLRLSRTFVGYAACGLGECSSVKTTCIPKCLH